MKLNKIPKLMGLSPKPLDSPELDSKDLTQGVPFMKKLNYLLFLQRHKTNRVWVCLCMCMCMCIYLSVCVCLCVCLCLCLSVPLWDCLCLYVYVALCVCVCVCACACVCLSMYFCMGKITDRGYNPFLVMWQESSLLTGRLAFLSLFKPLIG